MDANRDTGPAGDGFLEILGIIYLIKVIRKRRHARRTRKADEDLR